jgi:hypothetical protein
VESANPFFVLQKRKGRGAGLTGLLVGTLDSVLDSKVNVFLQALRQCYVSFPHFSVSISAVSTLPFRR